MTADAYLAAVANGWRGWVLEAEDGSWRANVQLSPLSSSPAALSWLDDAQIGYLASIMVIDQSARDKLGDQAVRFGLSQLDASVVLAKTRRDNFAAQSLLTRHDFWPCGIDSDGTWVWFVREPSVKLTDEYEIDRHMMLSIIRPFWIGDPQLTTAGSRATYLDAVERAMLDGEVASGVHRPKLPGFLSPSVRARRLDHVVAHLDPSPYEAIARPLLCQEGDSFDLLYADASVRYFDYSVAWLELQFVIRLDRLDDTLMERAELVNDGTRALVDDAAKRLADGFRQQARAPQQGVGDWRSAGRTFESYAINISARATHSASSFAVRRHGDLDEVRRFFSGWVGRPIPSDELRPIEPLTYLSLVGREGQAVVLGEVRIGRMMLWQWRLAIAMWGLLNDCSETMLDRVEREFADRHVATEHDRGADNDLAAFVALVQREADPVYAVGDGHDERVYATIWSAWQGDAMSRSTTELLALYQRLRGGRAELVTGRRARRVEMLLFLFGALSAVATVGTMLQLAGVESGPIAAVLSMFVLVVLIIVYWRNS